MSEMHNKNWKIEFDVAATLLVFMIFLTLILFAGTPDIADGIIEYLKCR